MAVKRAATSIEETAAEWMIRRDGGLTPGEEAELARWLEADARHRAAFHALGETWEMIGELEPARLRRSADRTVRVPANRREWRWVPVALAAAAALAVAFFQVGKPSGATPSAPAPFALATATEVGGLRQVDLPDGSVIQLNTNSAVEVRFEATERRVRLVRGEAHFTVAKNRRRPFVVSAAGVDVLVVGTVFNVRLGSESVDVLVTEGKVRVGAADDRNDGARPHPSPSPQSELSAGQKVSIAYTAPAAGPGVVPTPVSTQEIKQVLAWQARRLDFDATPLAEMVAEFNRYNRHKLVVADPRLNAQRFGGSFPAGDAETFVRMLETNFNVVAERRGEETWLRSKIP